MITLISSPHILIYDNLIFALYILAPTNYIWIGGPGIERRGLGAEVVGDDPFWSIALYFVSHWSGAFAKGLEANPTWEAHKMQTPIRIKARATLFGVSIINYGASNIYICMCCLILWLGIWIFDGDRKMLLIDGMDIWCAHGTYL